LITGGNGYLASQIIRNIVNDYQVVVIEKYTSELANIEAVINLLEVYSTEDFEKAFNKKVDVVLHCATLYGKGDEKLANILDSNLLFPLKLLQKSVTQKVSLFINTDTTLDRQTNTYSLTKKQFLDWLIFYQNKIKITNVQLEHFYGPGSSDNNFITSITRKLLKNDKIIELTKGEQVRDFVYIDDVISAFLKIFENTDQFNEFQNFQVCTGKPEKLRNVIELLKFISGSSSFLDFGAVSYRENEVMISNSDPKELNKIGWENKVLQEEGLKRTVDFEKNKLGK